MKKSFSDQLFELGKSAEQFILNAIPVNNQVILWSDEKEEETGEASYDMPDIFIWDNSGSNELANIVKLEHTELGFIVHSITKEWGSPTKCVLSELTSEEAVYLADFIQDSININDFTLTPLNS